MKTVWDFSGKSNLDELHKRLSAFMLRRTVSDVALELPPKTRQVINVPVAARKNMMLGGNASELRRALDASADAKLPTCVELLEEHLKSERRIVAFCWRRSVAEHLVDSARESGYEAELIHGGVSTLRRGAAVERAKSATSGRLLAVTIDSCATGIDFSFADTGVFIELTWQPHQLLQAEARLHRFGAVRPVLIQYVIASGTSDELVASAVVGKLDTFEATVGATGESLGAALSGSEEDIFAELYKNIGETQLRPGV